MPETSPIFFLRAGDGIRAADVTGVQTCAFFFSSRRRHTRCGRDWSSDVCSSDLRDADRIAYLDSVGISGPRAALAHCVWVDKDDIAVLARQRTRSEERRVGKECRSRWSPYH